MKLYEQEKQGHSHAFITVLVTMLFGTFIERELATWASVVKKANIKLE